MPEMPQSQPSNDAQRAAALAYRPLAELTPAHWTQGDLEASDGTRLHYTRSRAAPDGKAPLLLLHGFTDNGLCWLRVAQALEAGYDVVMPDARGHGRSGGTAENFTLARMTQDAADLIRALGLDRPAVLGHSMGGEVTARLALGHPDLVRAVVLEDPPVRAFRMPDSPEYRAWAEQWVAWLKALKTQTQAERLIASLERNPAMANWDEAEVVAWAEAQAQFNPEVLAQAAHMDYGVGTWDGIGGITCPVLLLAGNPARGGMVSAEDEATITAAWQRGRFVRFETAGHLPHREQYERFMEVLTAFLKEVYTP